MEDYEIEETLRKKNEVERFFCEAWGAKKTTIDYNVENFDIQSVVKIETGDKRGTFYVGRLLRKG